MPGLLDLFLPVSCGGCGVPAEADASADEALVCPGCRAALRGPCLGRILGPPGAELLAVAGTAYAGPARRLVIEYKERGRQGLARPLGQLLAGAVQEVVRATVPARRPAGLPAWRPALAARVVLVPVPSRAAARRARGFDHVAQLARAAAAGGRVGTSVTGGCAIRPMLAASAARRDQAGLDAAARTANIRGAWRVRGAVPQGPVVLVDDVVTTGATALELARVLHEAGARVLGVAAVAGVAAPGTTLSGPGAAPSGRASV